MAQHFRPTLPYAAGFVAAVLAHILGAPGGTALADSPPKRGGSLEFAVDAEPPNYDCHANVSFAVLHPIAPHYSTILKFDTANYPQVQGDSESPERYRRITSLIPSNCVPTCCSMTGLG
jgi:hypothetical protein